MRIRVASIELQNAYILHSRPFRNTSLLIELFTLEQGRVTVIARGFKGKKKSPALIQPFVPLRASFGGRNDLKLLYTIESSQPPFALIGKRLFSGLYLN